MTDLSKLSADELTDDIMVLSYEVIPEKHMIELRSRLHAYEALKKRVDDQQNEIEALINKLRKATGSTYT